MVKGVTGSDSDLLGEARGSSCFPQVAKLGWSWEAMDVTAWKNKEDVFFSLLRSLEALL